MAATITWADPSTAWATGMDGSPSWLAIWRADSPASTYRNRVTISPGSA